MTHVHMLGARSAPSVITQPCRQRRIQRARAPAGMRRGRRARGARGRRPLRRAGAGRRVQLQRALEVRERPLELA